MKHRILFSLCGVFALSMLLTSCGSEDKNALPVPSDAAFVLHLNTKALSAKLTWDEIKQTSWFKEGQSEATDSLVLQLLNNPESSGIDTKDEIAFFVKRANTRDGYAVLTGRIKDAVAFETFNKKISEGGTAVASKEGDLSSMNINKKTLVSWTGNKFLYVVDFSTPGMDWESQKGNYGFDSSGNMIELDSNGNALPKASEDMSPSKAADLKAYAARLFKMSGDSLLVNDSRYSNLIKKEADMHLWTNAEYAYGAGMPFGMMSALKIDNYIKNSVNTAALNFENGKIVLDAKFFSNEEMTALLKKYQGKSINTDLIERIPADSVLGLMVFNYPPEGLKEFLKLGGLDGMANSFMGEIGITLDDFIAANKGDMLIAVTRFGYEERTIDMGGGMEPIKTNRPTVNVLFANSIGNKASFDKLVQAGKTIGEKMSHGEKPFVFYNMNNDLFVAGSDQQTVDTYLKGGSKKNFAFLSKLKGHPFGAYVDLQRVIGSTVRSIDHGDNRYVDASLAMWQDVVYTGGEFNDGGVEQHLEINLVDKNTNSLKQLNQYADKMHKAKKGF